MYDFNGDVSTFYTGDGDISKAGLLATYNRSPKLPQWDLPCGEVKDASDGTKFPSFLQPNDTFKFYRKSLCRGMPLVNFFKVYFCGIIKFIRYSRILTYVAVERFPPNFYFRIFSQKLTPICIIYKL